MGRRIVSNALPTIEEIVAEQAKKAPKKPQIEHESTDKPIGQPKLPGDTSLTEIDSEFIGNRGPGEGGNTPAEIVEDGGEGAPPMEAPEVPEVKAPEPEKKDFLASKFAALARKEKATREAQAAADKRAADLEAREKALTEKDSRFASAKSPLEVMKAHGWSYQDITEAHLGMYKEPEKDPEDVKFEERFKPLAEKQTTVEKEVSELKDYVKKLEEERVQYQQTQFRNSIVETAKADGCDMIQAAGDEAISLVQQVMAAYWNQHKKVLSFSEACGTVETYYTDRISKLSEVEKIRSRITAAPQLPAKPSKEVKSPNTLTQSLSQGTRATPDIDKLPKQAALDELAKRLRYSNS